MSRIVVSLLLIAASIGTAGLTRVPQGQAPKATPEVRALLDLGNQASDARHWEEAIRYYEAAIAKARSCKDVDGEARGLHNIALRRLDMNQPEMATPLLDQALVLSRQVGDKQVEARTLRVLGDVRACRTQWKEALELWGQARVIFREIGANVEGLSVLQSAFTALLRLGESDKALDMCEKEIASFRHIGDRKGEADLLAGMGQAYHDRQQLVKALEYRQVALKLYRQLRDVRGEALMLAGIGDSFSNGGQHRQAVASYDSGLLLISQLGDIRTEAVMLRNAANAADAIDDVRKALTYRERALDLCRQTNDKREEVTVLGGLVASYCRSGQWQKARDLRAESVEEAKRLADPQAEAVLLESFGWSYHNARVFDEALECRQKALELYRDQADERGQARLLSVLGDTCTSSGMKLEAGRYYDGAIDLFRKVGDKSGEVVALRNAARSSTQFDLLDRALAYREQALLLLYELPIQAEESLIVAETIDNYCRMGEWKKAREFQQVAIERFRRFGDRGAEGWLLGRVADAWERTGDGQQALENREQALAAHRLAGNAQGEASALSGVATSCLRLGDRKRADEYIPQALTAYRQVDDLRGAANMLSGVAFHCLFITGDIGRGLQAHEMRTELLRQAGDAAGEAGAWNDLGYHLTNNGQPEQALACHERALAILRKANGEHAMFAPLETCYMAWALAELGKTDEASALYSQALDESRRLGDMQREAQIQDWVGEFELYYRGDVSAALRTFSEALPISRSFKDEGTVAWMLKGVGDACFELGQWKKAEENHREALGLFQKTGPRTQVPATIACLAADQRAQGRLDESERNFRTALALNEALRDSLGGRSDAKARFLSSTLEPYDRFVSLLLDTGRAAAAFDAVQGRKARVVLDLLGNRPVRTEFVLSEAERSEKLALQRRIEDLNLKRLSQVAANGRGLQSGASAMLDEAARAEREYQAFMDRIRARNPAGARRSVGQGASNEVMGKLLPDDSAILEYAVLKAGAKKGALDRTVLLVQTSHQGRARVSAYDLKLSSGSLSRLAADLRASCSQRRGPWGPPARELYRRLVAPAASQLRGKKRLIVCPDGPLWDVPFQVLVDSAGRVLVESHELVYSHSASVTRAALSARRPGSSGLRLDPLVIANPDIGPRPGENPRDRKTPGGVLSPKYGLPDPLPGTVREAQAIKRVFPGSDVRTGRAAQESAVKKDAQRYRYLHFATHGLVNDAAPMLSSLAFARPEKGSADDGFLTALEIADLDLQADLAVLSACNSGRGGVRRGEGLVGLTWAMSVAGVRSQVLTQWAVDDARTTGLMGDFYTRLKRGETKASALRAAALALKKDRLTSHPYYWAPFVLIGDWR